MDISAMSSIESPAIIEAHSRGREPSTRPAQTHHLRRRLDASSSSSEFNGRNNVETYRLPWAHRLAVLAGQALWHTSDQSLHDALDAWARPKEDALIARGELPPNGVLVYTEAGHGGLGNQIIGLVSTLYLAYGSDRLLLVK